MRDVIERKIRRMRAGERPRVFDLFSGCGGMTLGFVRAGCTSLGGVELDPEAAASHQRNFHPKARGPLRDVIAAPKDITSSDPVEVLRSYGHMFVHEAVDFLVGGPPCPTFTRVGRAKLREVHQDPEAFLNDPRAKLYLPYLQYVEALAPVAILMENVPDFLNWGGHNLAEEICEVLEGLGYHCAYTLLNAANYGVPQMRERFFLIGIHEAAEPVIGFPSPTHHVEFPPGYEGTRRVALKHLDGVEERRHVPTPRPGPDAKPAVTVEDALSDLPSITGHLDGSIRRGARRFDQAVSYGRPLRQASPYAQAMRTWPGFEANAGIVDHVIRSLSNRDYRLFREMAPGDDYPKAFALAQKLHAAEVARRRQEGTAPEPGTEAWETLLREYVPPYDPGKFPNKWRKMEPDEPARTLMAHLGKDSYSHIHYDGDQARVLSVREAARLQSFPDGFAFHGTMNPALRQIGNAVPPLLAWRIAEAMIESAGLGTAVEPKRAHG